MKKSSTGSSFKTAINLGKFTDNTVITEGSVNGNGNGVFYKINLLKRSFSAVSLTGLQADADLDFYYKNKSNFATLDNGGTQREYTSGETPKGIYYLRVFPAAGKETTYKLNIFCVTL